MWHWERSPCFLPGGNGDHAQEKWLTISLPFVSGPAHITLSLSSVSFLQYLCESCSKTSLADITSPSPPPPLPYFDILRHLLQLIDSFASEIGELKEEMVQTSPTADMELMDSQGWDTSPFSLEVTLRLPDIPIQLLVLVILFYFFLVTVAPLDLLFLSSETYRAFITLLTSRGQECFILRLSLSLFQFGEWDKWCLPAAPGLRRGGEWKGFWVRLLTEEDECSGQADSNPPGMAAADCQWGGGRPHTPQTATAGEASRSGAQIFTLIISGLISCLLYTCVCAPQVFLVRKSAALQRKILSVRVGGQQFGTSISHFPIRENKYSKHHVWIVRLKYIKDKSSQRSPKASMFL